MLRRIALSLAVVSLVATACLSPPALSPTRNDASAAPTPAAQSLSATPTASADLGSWASTPHLRLLGRLGPETANFGPPATFLESAYGVARNLIVAGAHAYVIQGSRGSGQSSWGRLAILDIADPARPAVVGRLATERAATDLAMVGATVFVTDGQCEFGWGVCLGALYRMAVSDPTVPHLVAKYELNDLRNDGQVRLPGLSSWIATAVEATATHAYVSGGAYGLASQGICGLRVFDVSVPEKIVPIGALKCQEDEPAWAAMDLLLHGGTLYAAGGDAGLYVVDISDPTAPREVAHLPVSGGAWALETKADRLYVAARAGGLVVYGIQNPPAPTHLTTIPLPYSVANIAQCGDNTIALAGENGGVWLFELPNLSGPVAVASYPGQANSARGVQCLDETMLIADLVQGVLIFELPRK